MGWTSKHGLMYEEAQTFLGQAPVELFLVKYRGGWSFPHWPSFFFIDNQQGCISVILFCIMH